MEVKEAVKIAIDYLAETLSGKNPFIYFTKVTSRKKALKREINFRAKQVDEVLEKAKSKSALCQKGIERKGTIKGTCVRDFLNTATRVTVVFELGGIYRIPGKGEDSVLIHYSGYGLRHLPEKQGYKDSMYSNNTFGEVLEDYLVLVLRGTSEDIIIEMNNTLDKIKEEAQFKNLDILEDWHQRHQATGKYKDKYGGAYKVYDSEMDDFKTELGRIEQWLNSVNDEWSHLKRLYTKLVT
uniref:Uncharacterized protein n=1 Tax=Candidatus Kentrum eta TaxID=2126337 RepID=A0A450UE82_9GAMM|nr:MAG: hypothetical protein BECKH772A_GA0070896_1001038 [Candidatus Kentron sp. H]VFJ90818.1 MAG: hypothetical protein BECKH772B_GA0070898_1001138 [Candidatus Kentron sp. H]VFJ96932.1 MAG: hypothetical protein BECKH772C_GA0070978_1000938 [Candidatus Kentron sp. H]